MDKKAFENAYQLRDVIQELYEQALTAQLHGEDYAFTVLCRIMDKGHCLDGYVDWSVKQIVSDKTYNFTR